MITVRRALKSPSPMLKVTHRIMKSLSLHTSLKSCTIFWRDEEEDEEDGSCSRCALSCRSFSSRSCVDREGGVGGEDWMYRAARRKGTPAMATWESIRLSIPSMCR